MVATPPRNRLGTLVGDFGDASSSASTSKSVRRKPWIAEMDPGKLSEMVFDKRKAQGSDEFKVGAAVWHETKGFAYIEDIDLQEGRQKPFSVRCAVRPPCGLRRSHWSAYARFCLRAKRLCVRAAIGVCPCGGRWDEGGRFLRLLGDAPR